MVVVSRQPLRGRRRSGSRPPRIGSRRRSTPTPARRGGGGVHRPARLPPGRPPRLAGRGTPGGPRGPGPAGGPGYRPRPVGAARPHDGGRRAAGARPDGRAPPGRRDHPGPRARRPGLARGHRPPRGPGGGGAVRDLAPLVPPPRRYVWVPPLLALAVALVVRLTVVFRGIDHLVRRAKGPHGALVHAHDASWAHRLVFTLAVIVVFEILLGVLVSVRSRQLWRARVGDGPPEDGRSAPAGDGAPSSGLLVNGTDALDLGRQLVGEGATGLVVGGGLRAELSHLAGGFFATPGGTTELVRKHPGRAGLPPGLPPPPPGRLDRARDRGRAARAAPTGRRRPALVDHGRAGRHRLPGGEGLQAAADLHPALVASWPRGASWPPAPEVAAHRVRVRRVRRTAAALIFAAGLFDLLLAVSPPLRATSAWSRRSSPSGWPRRPAPSWPWPGPPS